MSVPTFTISSSFLMGVNAEARQMAMPVTIVAMCGVRNRGCTCPKTSRQQPVAGHRHENPRLAQEQHQKHAGHARQTADGDDRRRAGAFFWLNAVAIGASVSMEGYGIMPVITNATAM